VTGGPAIRTLPSGILERFSPLAWQNPYTSNAHRAFRIAANSAGLNAIRRVAQPDSGVVERDPVRIAFRPGSIACQLFRLTPDFR